MRKAEIDALMRAHSRRAGAVASLHVLRQSSLDPDDQAFLTEHAGELNSLDLLRWWARCEEGRTALVMQQIARLAVLDPGRFLHEILGAPRLELGEHEWTELEDLLRGKLPDDVWQRLRERGRRPAPAPEPAPIAPIAPDAPAPVDAGEIDLLADLIDGDPGFLDDMPDPGAGAPGADQSIEAVAERARATGDLDERAGLIEWLEQRGAPRRILLELALDTLRAPALPPRILGHLGRGLLPRQLSTRAAWEAHGEAVLRALLDRRAFSEIGELVTITWTEATHARDRQRGLLAAVQLALASTLLDVTRAAVERGEDAVAMGALSALLCLDPPSRLSGAVRALRHLPGLRAEALELVALNERLVKHGRGRDASLEDVIAAVHALADALG
ncbi:MAG: hypothetical protein IT372_07705 [Polyangiaceae bacterium]|nr:hypothetical protein [Polyangiaceae bacterium]